MSRRIGPLASSSARLPLGAAEAARALCLAAALTNCAPTMAPSAALPAVFPGWGALPPCRPDVLREAAEADAAWAAEVRKAEGNPQAQLLLVAGQAGLQSRVACYERVDDAPTCLTGRDPLLLPILRSQYGDPFCIDGPLRSVARDERAARSCCYTLLHDVEI